MGSTKSVDIFASVLSRDFMKGIWFSPTYREISILTVKILIETDETYRTTSNISRTLLGNGIVDHSDVIGASPVGAAPTTSSFST